jgi:dipeptidyl-peptidase-3
MRSDVTPVADAPPTTRPYLLEQIDDAAVVQLYADGFEKLTLKEKTLVYHLYRAAIAGRDIYYDQRHRLNLGIRQLLEEILRHPAGLPADTLNEITRYTKLFWINTGPYNNLTARKFLLNLDKKKLLAAMEIARDNGADFELARGETLKKRVDKYAKMLFDPDYDPMVTFKTPGEDQDILESSANNLYVGVTMDDFEGFEEKYQLNSRVVKKRGKLVEEVYKIGGLYDRELRNVVAHLRKAIPFAPAAFATALEALIKFYETGSEEDREAFDIAWVQNRDCVVDTMNGFIEVYMDARGMKGSWEGLVYYTNHEKTAKIRALAEHAQWFEDHLPIDPKYRKPQVQGVSAQAIDVVVEAGDSGPITPIGVNLPNDQRIREQYGSKSVSLSNVLDAYERALPDSYRQEFCWDDAEVERAKQWGAFASELTTEIHEVLGHGSGRMAEHITVTPQDLLKEQYSALEETRADLVALYFVGDPYLAKIGLVSQDEQQAIAQTEYEAYARNALVQLRRVREGAQLEEDHMRNRQAIVHWLLANSKSIDVRRRDEKTYFVVVDTDAFRRGVARLLGEVQRIKSEGDYAKAKELFETYGIHFDPEMRDEVVKRVEHLKLSSYTGFVMPKLEPVTNKKKKGEIIDVKISYPCDFMAQMLEYSRMD